MADDQKPAQPAPPPGSGWKTQVLTTDGTFEPYDSKKHDIKPARK